MATCTKNLFQRLIKLNPIHLAFILLTSFSLYSCGDDSKASDQSTSQQWKSPITSPAIINEIHEKQLKKLADYQAKNLEGLSIAKISEIHYYLYNQRWTTGGDISRNSGTNYEEAAEDLQIPVSKLKEADFFYDNQVRPQLATMIQTLYKGHLNIELDYHRPLRGTAYCGNNTVVAGIILYDKKDEEELKKDAASIAERLRSELPAWVDGFKLHYTTLKDTVLETSKKLDIGFLWKRGEDIRPMKASEGLMGYTEPTENTYWHTDEWNDLKPIQQPAFKEIQPRSVGTQPSGVDTVSRKR